jgi:hypothetical protein
MLISSTSSLIVTMRSALQLTLLSLLFSGIASQGTRNPGSVLVTVLDSEPVTYESQIAYFGDDFQDDSVMGANVMVPPDDVTLCDYPPSLLNMTLEEAQNLTASQSSPIALLVSRGKCPFDQKARVALAMQQQLSSLLKYMVIYNNNFSTPNFLVTMSTAATDDSYELESMGFLFVSTSSGVSILDKIDAHENSTGTDATLLSGDDNSDWYLPLFLEVVPTRDGDGGSSNTRSDPSASGRNTFYWLRFVLFTLLIVSPCARAGYLWYSAGGRLLLRRNNQGHVTGLQYVRPMPYWFASGVEAHHQEDHVSSLMTEEEVNALPEIIYQRKDEDEDRYYEKKADTHHASEGCNETNETAQTKDSTDSDDVEKPVSVDVEQPAEEEIIVKPEQSLKTPKDQKVTPAATAVVDQSSAEESAAPQVLITTCTMCSICIDDFEDGEKIRVLPKCRHGFHTECIIPWLTERQSCCPLCKTSVLGSDDDQEDNATTTTTTNNNDTTTSNNNDTHGNASVDADNAQDSPA